MGVCGFARDGSGGAERVGGAELSATSGTVITRASSSDGTVLLAIVRRARAGDSDGALKAGRDADAGAGSTSPGVDDAAGAGLWIGCAQGENGGRESTPVRQPCAKRRVGARCGCLGRGVRRPPPDLTKSFCKTFGIGDSDRRQTLHSPYRSPSPPSLVSECASPLTKRVYHSSDWREKGWHRQTLSDRSVTP